jgi:dihydrolipoamide dehydrogenase
LAPLPTRIIFRSRTKEGKKTVRFAHAIIAAGSQSAKLPFLPATNRIVDSTGALELRTQPKKLLVIGGGIIGLEMGTVYSTLGRALDVVEMLDGLMLGADPRPRQRLAEVQCRSLRQDHAEDEDREGRGDGAGIKVWFEGEKAPAEPQTYDWCWFGRRSPNGKRIGAENAGVAVDERGFIATDSLMRHQRRPHLRDRRHRKAADARAQSRA